MNGKGNGRKWSWSQIQSRSDTHSTTTFRSIILFQNRVVCSHTVQAHPVTGLAYLVSVHDHKFREYILQPYPDTKHPNS
jgi:hypothetical protein